MESESDSETSQSSVDLTSPVSKIRSLVKKIKFSEQTQLKLKSFCEAVNCKMTKPKLDMPTRWNSTFEMLVWSLSVKEALNILCDNISKLKDLKITEKEWILISNICQYLRSFKTLSSVFEGEKYCTLPMVVIGVNMLLDKLKLWAHELDHKIERATTDEQMLYCIQAARDKIVQHYNKTNWIYCVVLILDPRHKVDTFSSTSWGKLLQSQAVQAFEEVFKKNYFNKSDVSYKPMENSKKDKVYDSVDMEFDLDITCLFKKEENIVHSEFWRNEIQRYLSEPRANNSEDILDWWRRHENIYPTLPKMAKDFLATPATSVPAKRLFSRAALTVTKSRNRLALDSVRSLMCLNSWLLNSDIKSSTNTC